MGNIPANVDRETAKKLAGDRFTAEIFDKFRDNEDRITRERLLELDKIVRVRPAVPLMTQKADPVLVSAIVPVHLPPPPSSQTTQASSCEAVVQNLKTHGNYASAAENGCKSLWSLAAVSEANRVKLGGIGACEVLLQTIKAHSKVATVAEYACGALKTLSINSENQIKLGALGAGDEIVQILRSHGKGSSGVLAQALECIKSLSHRSEPNKTSLISASACEAMIETLKDHLSEERIAQYGSGAMINLAASVEGRQRLMANGACNVLSEVLREHKHSIGVCQYACWVLINLAADDAIRTALGTSGVCGAVVDVLREHVTISGVVEYSCWAVVNLSANSPPNRARLCNAGVCEAVLQALQRHPNNQGVATQGSRAVYALTAPAATAAATAAVAGGGGGGTANGVEIKMRLVQNGAIPLLTAVGDNSSYSLNTWERAKEAISRLL